VLSYGVLGPLRVTHAGLPVPVGAKKQRTVLALLLARANRAVGLDDLVDEVWSHDPPVSAVANVRTYAANLRRAFAACGEPDALTRSGDGYQLTVGMAACDALAFDELRPPRPTTSVAEVTCTVASGRWRRPPRCGAGRRSPAWRPVWTTPRPAVRGRRAATILDDLGHADAEAVRARLAGLSR
jgi:DNA-binding winged helix-turn-helix (wHTH) protein